MTRIEQTMNARKVIYKKSASADESALAELTGFQWRRDHTVIALSGLLGLAVSEANEARSERVSRYARESVDVLSQAIQRLKDLGDDAVDAGRRASAKSDATVALRAAAESLRAELAKSTSRVLAVRSTKSPEPHLLVYLPRTSGIQIRSIPLLHQGFRVEVKRCRRLPEPDRTG